MKTIIVCFQDGTSAAEFRDRAERLRIPGRIAPSPRALQASCGLAWVSPVAREAEVLALAETVPHGVVVRYEWGGTL